MFETQALDNVSAILRFEISTQNRNPQKQLYHPGEIKDAALKAERLGKEKPIKANNSVNEINDQEPEIDAVNNRGNFQNNYRGNNSRGRGGYPPARGGYRGPPNNNNKGTPPTNQGRGAYRGNPGNQSQNNRGGQNQNNSGSNDKDNCKYCKKPSRKLLETQAKKASMKVNNENEFHEDNSEQNQYWYDLNVF
jgi:hypothetical protein